MRNRALTLTLLALLCFGLLLSSAPPLAWAAERGAAVNGGAIAFIRHTENDGDQIWLVGPDGNGEHAIYAPGVDATYDHTNIDALSWRPGASELAFSSDREAICSIWQYDLYTIRPNGGGYQRVTNAPACQEFAKYPKGSVTLSVEVYMSDAPVVYLQGASKPEFGPAGGVAEVTFKDVADLGTMHQFPVGLYGYSERWPGVSGVDVIAGKAVHVPQPLQVTSSGYKMVGAYTPSWNSSGSQLSYVFSLNTLRAISSNPPLLTWGNDLLQSGAVMPLQVTDLAWSPSPARANQLLYRSWDVEPPYTSIWLATVGSNTPGQRLLERTFEGQDFPGFAWLHDGSGFIYSQTDVGTWGVADRGNIYQYNFATGQSTPLTEFAEGDYPMKLSVSPDGGQIVFERTTAKDRSEPIDLWVIDRDGGNLQLVARDAESPAWSPAALPTYRPSYLPLTMR